MADLVYGFVKRWRWLFSNIVFDSSNYLFFAKFVSKHKQLKENNVRFDFSYVEVIFYWFIKWEIVSIFRFIYEIVVFLWHMAMLSVRFERLGPSQDSQSWDMSSNYLNWRIIQTQIKSSQDSSLYLSVVLWQESTFLSCI